MSNAAAAAQGTMYGEGHNYTWGSPHLRHASIREEIDSRLVTLVRETLSRTGSCRILEVGAGHGTFTSVLLDAGADVVVTEVSEASAEHLRHKFAGNPRVRVRHDPNGDAILDSDETWDAVVLISVLHHIPDYLGFLSKMEPRITAGGSIFSAQDPLYYPRMSRLAHWTNRGTYFLWRLGQGNFRRGVATRLRRLRRAYDRREEDLVEYHVVRKGCDEEAISDLLSAHFDVETFRYWSSQDRLSQRLFERTRLTSDFAIHAANHRQSSPSVSLHATHRWSRPL